MKATIRDKSVLAAVRPFEAASYLRASGWAVSSERPGKFSVWEKSAKEGGAFEVVLPLDMQFLDFPLRISDLLQTLAVAEQRSQTEIFADIQTSSADVVRVRFHQSETEDATISLDQGVPLVANARELMLAAACATIEPRAYFATKKPGRAEEYARGLRLGQSEIGSFVLRVLSPVSPHLGTVQGSLFDEPEPPFERKVTLALMRSLGALRLSADDALNNGTFSRFTDAVKDGVSANLCTALVHMAGPLRSANASLSVALSWAKSRPAARNMVEEVVFPGDRFPLIEEAARLFKASAPHEEIELRGLVVKMQRKDESGPPEGPVALWAFVDGRPRKVNVQLGESDHKAAIDAYAGGLQVVCAGDLVKSGQLWTLQNPHGFAIVPDEAS